MDKNEIKKAFQYPSKKKSGDVLGQYLLELLQASQMCGMADRYVSDPRTGENVSYEGFIQELICLPNINLSVSDGNFTPLTAAIVNLQETAALLIAEQQGKLAVRDMKRAFELSLAYDMPSVAGALTQQIYDEKYIDETLEKYELSPQMRECVKQGKKRLLDDNETVYDQNGGNLSGKDFMDLFSRSSAQKQNDLIEKLYIIGRLSDRLGSLNHNDRMKIFVMAYKEMKPQTRRFIETFIRQKAKSE